MSHNNHLSPNSGLTLTNLDSATIPLTGRHLIEASAGTGKTYNITRIYLRLLLEREFTVEQILLMTFTKDATQELRGRIDAFIRDALTNWQTLCENNNDSYFRAIDARVDADKRVFLLKRALLFLDEAAIFTIHGFCQRALTQHAFASGLPFNATMSTNSSELVLQASQDWYRQLSKQSNEDFALVTQFWATPSAFVSSFAKAIAHRSELTVIDVQQLVGNFCQLAKQAVKSLAANEPLLAEGLVSHKNENERDIRAAELIKLTSWLSQVSECQNEFELLAAVSAPMPDYLLNANRHPKAFKTQLAQVLASAKAIKAQVKELAKNINKAKAYQIIRVGIYQVREKVKQDKAQLTLLDFDDLINTLADCLQNEGRDQHENVLAKTLLAQYPVALVDEFQDTDPQQFAILQGIYYQNSEQQQPQVTSGSRGASALKSSPALYLIGDPKQAIYGFRGGDIFAYLNARSDCDYHWLMDTNWRSSLDMIDAYNQVFACKADAFGYGIAYQPVLAGKKSEKRVVINGDSSDVGHDVIHDKSKALQFVHFSEEEPSGEQKPSTKSTKKTADKVNQSARTLMATWCANEIIHLLTCTSTKPQDIAILVRDGREANDIKEALLNANLASVYLSDRANLFHSDEAQQLIHLLKGILSPEDERLYLRALTSGLLGYNAQALYALQNDEIAYQKLKFCFFDYRTQWQRQGFITMAINIMHQHFDFSTAQVLSNKDRTLTNLLHLFEILQSASQRFLQPQELLHWFEQQCSEDFNANSELEAEQRLESDGDLIRIVTQHGAKGLEYPVVFIPFATRHKDPLKFGNKSVSYLEYHDEKGQLCLSLDGDEQARLAMADEVYAESIRLLYVAITRAEQRCYILTTAFDKYALSPLGKTLQWQADQNIVQSLQCVVAQAPQVINVQQVAFAEISADCHVLTHSDNLTTLQASKFVGKIERDWWLSSFSALTRNLRHGGVSTPDRDSSELLSSVLSAANNRSNQQAKQLRFELAKGAHSGNLLHDILEHSNFMPSVQLQSNLLDSLKWPLVKYGELTTGFDQTDLVAWLDDIVSTPLISNQNNTKPFSLHDIPLHQTLRESEFYFPMAQANVAQLEELLTDHRNTGVDAEREGLVNTVRLPSYQSLKGMMHGFIDLVFEHNGKYYVCDYKSSHLGDDFSDYNQQALRGNIEKNYYDLQYLIYSLALHRFLQQKIPDYRPDIHFGGIYYLYLRGMTADENHQGAGVYFREIPATELCKLDDIFSGSVNATSKDTAVLSQEDNR
ncbi:exodeoxyribonuclease V subunit beta [Colwellia sp. KU-HH00111]|uniref:exodeoxyribonuclease V subunit beta n=1 Tax=Colwellia sp. KU-HH00111 TaxID=3127652 RepID=UPI003101C4BE